MFFVAAAVDCESLHSGWPQQPVNAWSSLAFVAVGGVLAIRGRSPAGRLVGVGAVLVGVGSLLFHGDDGDFGAWLHDWSIAALLLFLIFSMRWGGGERPWLTGLGLAAVGSAALIWIAPGAGEWVGGALALGVGAREAVLWSTRDRLPMTLAVGSAGAGGLLTILGRSSGPWCAPESVLQPHAGWHILAAAGLAFYAVARGWLGLNGRTRDTARRLI